MGATHLIKVAVEAALGVRAHMDVYGTDYPTPDGTCIRDFVHVRTSPRLIWPLWITCGKGVRALY